MHKVAILQSNYIPWKGYFDIIHDVDTFVYYDEVQYTKNDWRNRNKIYSKNGLQWLTIPISKEAVKLKISQVALADHDWQALHYKSIYYAYKQAPYFRQLEPLLQNVYMERQWVWLVDINRYLLETIARMIGINTAFVDSKDLEQKGDRVDRLIDILRQLKADIYITGPSARAYLAQYEHKFADQGIVLSYKDYAGYPSYRQLGEPFAHAVSIVDLLANVELSTIGDYIWRWRTSPSMSIAHPAHRLYG
jgi:hypothetical protein